MEAAKKKRNRKRKAENKQSTDSRSTLESQERDKSAPKIKQESDLENEDEILQTIEFDANTANIEDIINQAVESYLAGAEQMVTSAMED
eukprot:1566774-Rhodomonas_salina.3